MNIYDDVLDATVVSQSVTGHFTTREYEELLAVRTNILCIYRYTDEGKLFLTKEFRFHGKITDIGLVPLPNSNLDCLLLGTTTAKLSIVRYDDALGSIETLSLHFYEDKFKDISLFEMAKESQLRIDPGKNCIMLFNNDAIAILPFRTSNADEDEDEDDDDYDEIRKPKKAKTNKDRITEASSIFLAKELHKEIQNVIDIQFLAGFTNPAVAVLYEPKLGWAGNSKLVPHPVSYIILTLEMVLNELNTNVDGTVIGKVEELNWDFHTLIPISNGCIIAGTNELAYVDNTGVLQSMILLNSYSNTEFKKGRIIDKTKSEILFNKPIRFSWSLSDKDNNVNQILLLIDHQTNFYYVQLESEGRLLTKFDIFKLPIVNETLKWNTNCTCISPLRDLSDGQTMVLFMGFLSGDSQVVKLNNVKSAVETRDEHKPFLETVDDDDDDLYADENSISEDNKEVVVETVQPFDIEILSSLRNIGPITSLTTGKVCSVEKWVKGLANPNKDEFSVVGTSGNGSGSHLTEIQESVRPEVELALKFISITQIWTLKIKGVDKYLVTTDSNTKKSDIYRIADNFAIHKEGRFRKDDTTVYISMFGEKRIVQVTSSNLYLYDSNFRRLTTMKFDYEVVHVSVMDAYILITVSRGDIKIYELDSKHKKKLSKVELPEVLKEMVITSGVILKSNMCNEFLTYLQDCEEEQLLFTFVTADNQIIFFGKEHNDRIFQFNGVDQLNEMLYISTYQLPEEVIPDPSIKQVMINKLGHNNREEYLTILTFGGEIYQYKKSASRHSRFHKNANANDIKITGAPDNAYAKGVSSIERIMHYVPEYNDFSVIFVTGSVPYVIIKEDDSNPKIFKFANIPLVSMTRWGKKSVMCVDDIKNARVYTLDCHDIYYGNRLPIKRIRISDVLEDYETLTNVTYHEKTELFIVSYAKRIDYDALGEDGERLLGYQENAPHASGFQAGILLVNPKTWNVIDKKEFGANTIINDARTMLIQLDSKTRRKREYLVLGVAIVGTEDLPPSGSFAVYDITEVVPEPGKPDTNFKLSQIFHEEVRGSVSTVCEISGRFLINQSQKVLVRDVQEDNSVVPVAFLDIPVFVSDAKSFGNLLIIGDAMHGFQFVGFDAEPYRMIPLGRSITKLETVSIEFLVNGGEIYFAVTDTDCILHVFKYSPDEPNSLSGQRLIHCTSFNLHSSNTALCLIPKSEAFPATAKNPSTFQVVGAQTDGSIFKILPLKEDAYRRLYVVQQQFNEKDIQFGGLNPRMERLSNVHYIHTHVLRPMLDNNIIKKFSMVCIDRRKQIAQRAGRRAYLEIWRDLIDIEFSLRSLCE